MKLSHATLYVQPDSYLVQTLDQHFKDGDNSLDAHYYKLFTPFWNQSNRSHYSFNVD